MNGNRSTDILWCRAATRTVKVVISSASGGQLCVENLAVKFAVQSQQLADFNGDVRTDILWHKAANGETKIAHSSANGNQENVVNYVNRSNGWAVVHQ